MSTKIYHNPRCSKSRQTLQILEDKGIKPEIIEYLKTPPTESELKSILNALGKSPRELMRKGEAEYKEHNLADDSLSDDQLIAAMVKHPKLIERPIVISADNKYALGRPPESVLDIL
ncbi:arsenate reductase (glutaredoxin) [sulfur-oxidizing endosymbiont of Gigantopelta aegis]|uniref:arsenate reductase (glutaredoxin) n=1 Tax=sulfur-oxidizing endosymbiont of Gigantopelta aegis TaxID=2794934 RepID=UPI0018DB7835|nr:arsenate reductase (glutaredoxin) [sulfur-oxidizing endosymbiont of Gigantopelta aegis]